MPDHNATSDVLRSLRSLTDYDALVELLTTLGFEYDGHEVSTVDWPSELRGAVQELRVAARHGSFVVFYVRIPESGMLGLERQIAARLLRLEPHALFAFSDPSCRLWHIVHIRFDPSIERRRQLRRFVVDLRDSGRRAERLRTTAERLALLSIAPGEQLSAPEVQKRCDEAFRISEVTKGFLRAFVDVVKGLTERLKAANPSLLPTEQDALRQAQLLMDRLVFLYFVQRKGWLNGEEDYLFRRYEKCFRQDPDGPTYYQGHLLPLFRALSHKSAERPRSEQGEEAIPFLNGGLFELPLSYGTANPPVDERIHVPNHMLFDVFEGFLEHYNFTTTEDTPLDVEVAINPEVIGTIFETFVLTSEQEPQTNAPDRRKATGSFYTPRIVVHFICCALLRFYLAERAGIDEHLIKQLIEFTPTEQLTAEEERALSTLVSEDDARNLRRAVLSVRACDPAVGSGAFPVGLLQEMVKLITLLDLRLHGRKHVEHRNYAYHLKKQIIEECLYGVDIQEQAIQICELRLWLSLVVDYQVDESLALHDRILGIDPLPNLTFRVRVGDSLLDQVFGRDWTWASEAGHQDIVDQIKEAKRLYFEMESPEGKRELETKVALLQLDLMERYLEREASVVGATMPMLSGLTSRRQQAELEQTKARLEEIGRLREQCREARRLAAAPGRSDDWEHIRRFDAVRRELGVSFVWRLDFAEVFDEGKGFDIVFGNPPFVTARNKEMRDRYRARWPTSCYKKYGLLAPFTEVALVALLRPDGQFGYIMSNAFGTRDWGRPLVEQVLQHLELRNVVDCSGLMFPGHGTPTCVLLGHATRSKPEMPTLLCGTKPGMGQLHEEAEETELWAEIDAGWETVGFDGHRVAATQWATGTTRGHPWSLDVAGTTLRQTLEGPTTCPLRDLLADDIGVVLMTNAGEVFSGSSSQMRTASPSGYAVRYVIVGDEARDWSLQLSTMVLCAYRDDGTLPLESELNETLGAYLQRFRKCLLSRMGFANRTFEDLGRPLHAFERFNAPKLSGDVIIVAEIATHGHALPLSSHIVPERTALAATLADSSPCGPLLSLLNSSAALFWLKQVCFCKRESDDAERDTYYVFAGGKLNRLPVPRALLEDPQTRKQAEALAQRCSDLGALIPGLHPRKLFEHPGEAYTDWYGQLRGYQPPHEHLNTGWRSAAELRAAWQWAVEEMRRLRRQMVTLQEEMDWLMYGAYGLLPLEHPAVNLAGPSEPMPIDRMERPYRLLQHERDTPSDWPEEQRALWQTRLKAIAENEHVARIEQPAYKRRWEEPFDDGDFLKAYEWWLREKAEWLLEHRHEGGPVELGAWAAELRQDERIRAAYEVALDAGCQRGDAAYVRDRERNDFAKHLKRIIEEETVPDDRTAFKKKHEKLRGINPGKHLPNGVPRERFRSLTARPGWYNWAGQDIWGGVKGDAWDD